MQNACIIAVQETVMPKYRKLSDILFKIIYYVTVYKIFFYALPFYPLPARVCRSKGTKHVIYKSPWWCFAVRAQRTMFPWDCVLCSNGWTNYTVWNNRAQNDLSASLYLYMSYFVTFWAFKMLSKGFAIWTYLISLNMNWCRLPPEFRRIKVFCV